MKQLLILFVGIVIGAGAMYLYCCQAKFDLNPTAPHGLITSEQAKKLDEAYNPRYRLISDSLVKRPGGDNRSSWFALKEVRKYLDYAENEAKELGYTMNGVRIYPGAHPDQNGQSGYTTFFLVPTGHSHKSVATMLNMSLLNDRMDIPGGGSLNHGGQGDPPGANYLQ